MNSYLDKLVQPSYALFTQIRPLVRPRKQSQRASQSKVKRQKHGEVESEGPAVLAKHTAPLRKNSKKFGEGGGG